MVFRDMLADFDITTTITAYIRSQFYDPSVSATEFYRQNRNKSFIALGRIR